MKRSKQKPAIDGTTRFSDLPSSLVIDIIIRLPLKSVLSCRCVCKDWNRLFKDPSFIKLHRAASPIHILKRQVGEDGLLHFGQVIKDESTGDLGVETVNSLTKPNVPSSTSTGWYWCINSCNGLLCLMEDDNPMCSEPSIVRSVHVCNPLLGEWVSISVPFRNNTRLSSLALVFSAKYNQYKVLFCFKTETEDYGFHIYTLDGTKQWRSIDETERCHNSFSFLDFNTFLHSSLHWVGNTCSRISDEEHFICCFDVDTEKFSTLSLPCLEGEPRRSPAVQLGVINGCLCAFSFSLNETDDAAKIWVMKEYGVEKSWTMMLSIWNVIAYDYLAMMSYGCGFEYPVLLFSVTEEEILINDYTKALLFSYNMKRNILERFETCQRKTLGFPHVVAYNPSFISLQDVAKGEEVISSRFLWRIMPAIQ